MSANSRQVAGGHYVQYGDFQVWDAWWHWDLDAFEANIIKYVMRVKGDLDKRLEDLEKAEHYLQKYRELLTDKIDERCKQLAIANEESWNLSSTQREIVKTIGIDHLSRRVRQLDNVAHLIQVHREEITKDTQ